MKLDAVGYIRISKKDQSNFSLSAQEEQIRNWCDRKGIYLTNIFIDNGQSAKNFDRCEWRKLEAFIKSNHAQVKYLLVAKYDRFGRNVSESLLKIEQLEKKYQICIESVQEPIGMHRSSPYFFKIRTDMLLGADVELRILKDRTKFGINQARKQGRWLNAPPKGYIKRKNASGKTEMVHDPVTAPYVKAAFDLLIQGASIEEIRRVLDKKLFKITGHSTLQRMFKNPLYAGLIKVAEFYDDPEKLVKAQHEPIVTEEVWWKAQAVMSGRRTNTVVKRNEEVPLRGVLKCGCQNMLTAGNSRSKSGKYHWYYVCKQEGLNLSAKKLHQQFADLLKTLSLDKKLIEHIEQIALQKLKASTSQRENEITALRSKLSALTTNIEKLEEKFIMSEIDKETYVKWKYRYTAEQQMVTEKITQLHYPIQQLQRQFSKNLFLLSNLEYIFEKANLIQKQSFINLVFDRKLYYSNNIYRTPYLHPAFMAKALILKEKRLLEIDQPVVFPLNLGSSSEDGS